jgi:hypothetical protein
MSKVITFSRAFPLYHPRAGEPTYFVEKVWKSLNITEQNLHKFLPFVEAYNEVTINTPVKNLVKFSDLNPKHHTIRAGHRWKAGDYFSPRVWSGKPYNSKQIQFAPDIKIKKVWDFQIIRERDGILTWYSMTLNGKIFHSQFHTAAEIWTNDGLTYNEFCDWFKMDSAKKDLHFDGQVICWSDSIEY